MDGIVSTVWTSGHTRSRVTASVVVASALVVGLFVRSTPASANVGAIHWTQKSPGTSPPARWGGVEAYDKLHKTLVLFGGNNDTGNLGDTWLWNGTNWKHAHPATSPPARIYHYMAYDSTHHYVILFGGVTSTWVSDTWTWDGTNWTQRFPATSPGNRASYAGFSDDPAIGGVLLYGGYDMTNLFYDTWKWNGSTWIQLSPADHPSFYLASMAYSPAAGEVIAYLQGTADTWVFDGTNWVRLFPPAFPPSRYENGFAAVGKGGVLFGGGSGGAFFDDTWYYNGTTWVQLGSTGPSARGYVSLALDQTGKVVLFGGLDSSYVTLGDTWTLGP